LTLSEQSQIAAVASSEKLMARNSVEQFVKNYNHIGEIISKGYMTGITVADTYGDAKEAGASDFEATMLTMGHAFGEAAILNTELGNWILPELKGEQR
jgi:hypothetical protein